MKLKQWQVRLLLYLFGADLTLFQVRLVLLLQGITRKTFDRESRRMSGKIWKDLELEYRNHEVRFVLDTQGRIVCYRRTARVLAINKWFKYLEVGRLFLIDGRLVYLKKRKDCTISETAIIDPAKPLGEVERLTDTAVWGGEEELNVRYKTSDLRPVDDRKETFNVRVSETYFGLHSHNYVQTFRIDPRKVALYKKLTARIDRSGIEPFVRIFERVPVEPDEFDHA